MALTERRRPTFLTVNEGNFCELEVAKNEFIPTVPFLTCCRGLLKIMDITNSPAFIPAKLDLKKNMEKIEKKYNNSPQQFTYLQDIIFDDIKEGIARTNQCATNSLLWLKRELEFLHDFLILFITTEDELDVIMRKAYDDTLRDFHGPVIHVLFYLANQVVPYKKDLLCPLLLLPFNMNYDQESVNVLYQDLADYTKALKRVLTILNTVYKEHDLDNPEKMMC